MLTGLPAQDEEPDHDPAWIPRASKDPARADGAPTATLPLSGDDAPTPRADPGATESTAPTNYRNWPMPEG